MNYDAVIGLEVHVELKTESKMFCGCSADYFGKEPNTHVCPVCLGLPGALPVPNKKAIEWCIKIGLALNCDIPLASKFDRKNYFYPDLAKGYQISQYDKPFAINGYIELPSHMEGGKAKKIRIRRVHMEEDTGKLIHSEVNEEKVSLIDFNRSGVPLVEIVTDPDFTNTQEVVAYLRKLQQIVRYLDVSNADMEKGDMRLEPNISIRTVNSLNTLRTSHGETRSKFSTSLNNNLPTYKVEIKNINSFKFVEKAISYELNRQKKLLHGGKLPQQETRGWDEKKHVSISQRVKEEANDYRYFPEPDIPPFVWEQSYIKQLRSQLPELPDAKFARFIKLYSLSEYDSEILIREKNLADYFEEAVNAGKNAGVTPKQIANSIINKKIDIESVLPAQLIQTLLSSSQPLTIDESELEKIVQEVLANNQKAVEDYKNGKESAIMFLVGQVVRSTKKTDAKTVKRMIERIIKKN